MNLSETTYMPAVYPELLRRTKEIGFDMPADFSVGILLQTLISSKPNGIFLELGTGTGLSLAWMVKGMQLNSRLISLDNDERLIEIARSAFEPEDNVELLCVDGESWISSYKREAFDLIFADTWPGKYSLLEETLDKLKDGGYYVIDDMLPQENWPDGHEEKAKRLVKNLEERDDFVVTKMDWSTGIIIAVKKSKYGK